MKSDNAVKQYLVTPEIHKRFMEGHFAGKPEYDSLI
jgi:hypothetical protein